MLHWLNLRKQDVTCYLLHSYNDADIDFTKLRGQCSLKCLITKISENGIYLCYYCMVQTIIQNHCIFKNKTSVEPNIYAKLLFLYALSGCDATSLINRVAKATVFKNSYQINSWQKQLQSLSLYLFISNSKKLKKSKAYHSPERHRPFQQFPTQQTTYLEINCS